MSIRSMIVACLLILASGCAPTEEAGDAEAVVLTLNVDGMHCGGCEQAVVAAVSNVEGVVRCDASFEDGSATVEVESEESRAAIESAIARLGYEVRP